MMWICHQISEHVQPGKQHDTESQEKDHGQDVGKHIEDRQQYQIVDF